MHRALQRQLKRIAGITDDAVLASVLEEARGLVSSGSMSPEAAALLSGLDDLLSRVDGAYDQYERDLALRTRSLELSSEELSETNDLLREELASRNRALQSLRDTATELLTGGAVGADAEALAENDLESLSVLMARLVEEREVERRELDNQKFALDPARHCQHYRHAGSHPLRQPAFLRNQRLCGRRTHWAVASHRQVRRSSARGFCQHVGHHCRR
jgi:hypothetical protein